MTGLPAEAYLLALLSLPGMGPARLRTLLEGGTPEELWRGAGRPHHGLPSELTQRWATAAPAIDPASLWAQTVAAGGAAVLGGPNYPEWLTDDVDPPFLLSWIGRPDAVATNRRVAIVGTRRCTRVGREIAFELGRDLAAAGVTVVSGLAAGVDAAAHHGALSVEKGAPPLAVVGSGLDVVYPAANRSLWAAVGERGVVFSEAPPGAPPERWRFPARNRIIAAAAEIVVVVESAERGGSMHTVDEADRRAVEVMAVPGSVRSPASAGTNLLLHEGRAPARDATDVLFALGFVSPPTHTSEMPAEAPTAEAAAVLEAFEWEPATVDQLALRTGLALGTLALTLDELIDSGAIAEADGWLERVGRG